MSMIGTALAFLAACVRPSRPETISAHFGSLMSQAVDGHPMADLTASGPRPAPRNRREAQAALIDQLVIALAERPDDFTEARHTLNDRATGMEWWIANGAPFFRLHSVSDCGCQNVGSDASADNERGWAAFEAWRQTEKAVHSSPHFHEAIRLWKANAKARR